MRGIAYLLSTVVALCGVVVYMASASEHADAQIAPIFGIKVPAGYRDWKLISVAHEAGNNNDLRAILGNDVAVKAFREGKLPYPDGAIIARLAWSYVASEENNKIFGRPQSWRAPLLTFSSWSRTQRNMPRPAAGGSLNLKTACLPMRRSTKLAFLVTSLSMLETLSLRTTHPKWRYR